LTLIAMTPRIERAKLGNGHEHRNSIFEPHCLQDADQTVDGSALASFQAGDNTARDSGLRRNIVLTQVA
jgi:hypothetical protein